MDVKDMWVLGEVYNGCYGYLGFGRIGCCEDMAFAGDGCCRNVDFENKACKVLSERCDVDLGLVVVVEMWVL